MEDQQQDNSPNPDFAPGEIAAFDYSHEDSIVDKLSEDAKKWVLSQCKGVAQRDLLARRIEVEQSWEQELFERGYQFLFPRRGGGWQFSSNQTGNRNWSQQQSSGNYETNIFGAECDILTAALSRDVPKTRFEPADPDAGPDITASDKADKFVKVFARNNDLQSKVREMAHFLCVNGRFLTYTRTVVDGQRFGFHEDVDDDPEVPETEGEQPQGQQAIPADDQEDQAENESPVQSQRKPLGREIVTVIGKLAHKVPINTNDIHGMGYAQVYFDNSTAHWKGTFPWIANKITPGGGSIGDIGIDRLARINVALAIEGGYQTGDTYNRDCTATYTWLRPVEYMDAKSEIRDELFQQCPDGMLAVYVGANDSLALIRNECMDNHLDVEQAIIGSGQNRPSLMSKVVSVQRRLNNWIDLLNDFFIKTVPRVWMDSRAFNVEALNSQTNVPGQRGPFIAQPGIDSNNLMLQEPMPTHQPELPQFIQFFFGEMSEQLSGALPSLAGAETDTDTYRGIALQRDSSLQRLASPWGAIQKAMSHINRQAVMSAARCREKLGQSSINESVPGAGKVTLEVADLKGNILCFPESDSTFPETWTERASKYQQLVQDAPENPYIGKLLSLPKNMKLAKDASGLTELDVPESDSIDKQIAEFEILLATGPQPNPQIADAQQKLLQAAAQAKDEGPQAMQQFEQMAQQISQSIQSLPPQVSTVPVAQDASEDHATEAQECFEKMNSAEGRKLKKEQPEVFANLHLHWQEHTQMAQKLAPPQATKPTSDSISMAVDKMPPALASQAAQKFYGLTASPQDFQVQDATETEQKITEKQADYGRPVI